MTRLAVVAGMAMLALCGCGDDGSTPKGPTAKLDEVRGVFRGVRLGNSDRDVRRKLGTPARNNASAGIAPVGADIENLEGPPTLTPPPGSGPLGDHTYRYRGVTYLTTKRFGVFAFLVTDAAATRRGVKIGDSLAQARARYRGMRCDTATDEANAPVYDYCSGRVGRDRYILFGGDPISTITVAATAMD